VREALMFRSSSSLADEKRVCSLVVQTGTRLLDARRSGAVDLGDR
jgi:hypothetical protein